MVRIAVIGHVEHITLGRVPALPAAGDIVHLDDPFWLPGGGGGMTFFQLVTGPGEIVLFTAIVSARRREALARARVQADVVVGSAKDPREASARTDYPLPPRALVMTEGAAGGRVETATETVRFPAAAAPVPRVASYGAGDSFV